MSVYYRNSGIITHYVRHVKAVLTEVKLRIRLKRRMNDPYTPVPRGTIGTVKFVDDAGTLFMEWDNGSTLGLLPDVDDFEVVHR